MRKVKVYDADGKHVDGFNPPPHASLAVICEDKSLLALSSAQAVRVLNSRGFWVKGQTTSKGVKIK